MPLSIILSLSALLVCVVTLIFAPQQTAMQVVTFLTGVIAIFGLGINLVIWYLTSASLGRDDKSDPENNSKVKIFFNKINAPEQNRHETFVVMSGFALMLIFSSLLYVYIF